MYFNIKCIGKLPEQTDEFERYLVFETVEFERPKFDCIQMAVLPKVRSALCAASHLPSHITDVEDALAPAS